MKGQTLVGWPTKFAVITVNNAQYQDVRAWFQSLDYEYSKHLNHPDDVSFEYGGPNIVGLDPDFTVNNHESIVWDRFGTSYYKYSDWRQAVDKQACELNNLDQSTSPSLDHTVMGYQSKATRKIYRRVGMTSTFMLQGGGPTTVDESVFLDSIDAWDVMFTYATRSITIKGYTIHFSPDGIFVKDCNRKSFNLSYERLKEFYTFVVGPDIIIKPVTFVLFDITFGRADLETLLNEYSKYMDDYEKWKHS